MTAPIDWDSDRWGVAGWNVHESAWLADGKHDDETGDQ